MKAKKATMAIGVLLSAAAAYGAEGDDRFTGGAYDGAGSAVMHGRVLDGGPQVSLWSASAQTFEWTAGSTALATLSIGAWAPQGAITNGSTLRVNMPAAWQCTFEAGAALSFGGSAAGKVGAASYSGDGRALLIPVTAEFADGDTLAVSGLKVTDLRLCRTGAQWLGLDFTGDGITDACDEYVLYMGNVFWRGGSYDGWGLATSEALPFWLGRGTLLKVY